MNRLEQKVLSWLDGKLPLLVLLAVSFAGLAVRLPLMDHVSGDSQYFLLPWYEEIRKNGLSQQVGNYNFLYQMLIWLMTKLPLEPLYAYKLLSVIFDIGLAVAVGALAMNISRDIWKSLLAYGTVLLSPAVILNSAAWDQCDSIFCCFAVFALLALNKEKWNLSLILMGFAFSFKLQAVFFLPFILFFYYRSRRFSILRFGWIPAVMCLTAVPMLFAGRGLGEIFAIYKDQTGTYPYMAMNYPSFWLLLAPAKSTEAYDLLRIPAMILTVCVLAVLMICWLKTKEEPKGETLVSMAFLLCFTCVLFLPAMHERYGYPYEILAILLAVLMPKTIPLCGALLGISLCTYGSYLFKTEVFSLQILTVLNLVVYGVYLWYLNRRMQPREEAPRS